MALISNSDENFYDRFGSAHPLKENSSAHGEGGFNTSEAVKILNGMYEIDSAAPIYCSNGELKNREYSRPSAVNHLDKLNVGRGTECNYVWLPRAKDSVSNGARKDNMECNSSTMGSSVGGKPMKLDSVGMRQPESQREPNLFHYFHDEANNGRLSELSLLHSDRNTSIPNKDKQYVQHKTAAKFVSSEDGERYTFLKNGSSAITKPVKLDSTVISPSHSQRESYTFALKKNGYSEGTKPLKLVSTEMSLSKPLKLNDTGMSRLNSQRQPSSWCSAEYNTMHKDMEDFLFQMLGEGFQLERDVIRDTLERCGYDMSKCVGRLSNLSGAILASRKSSSHSDKFRDSSSKPDMNSPQSNLQKDYSRGVVIENRKESNKNQKDIDRLQNEIWYALFDPKRIEESPKVAQALRKSMALGEVVVEPFKEPTINENISLTFSRQNDYSGEEENYQLLRRAVMEHRATMKEYYKDAAMAFSEGDYAKADELLKKGYFFKEKAAEADEESYKQIIEKRNADIDNEMLLDLHEQGAKEAALLLKCHLSSLAGIPSFKYLKVIIEKNVKVSEGARGRLVLKLLQRESIEWNEGEPGTIILDLEKLDPKKLSFVKRQ